MWQYPLLFLISRKNWPDVSLNKPAHCDYVAISQQMIPTYIYNFNKSGSKLPDKLQEDL